MPNIFTIANGLTFSRLVLLPFVIVGIATDNGWLAVVAMFLAWFTDLLDGKFARRAGPPTAFGKALDSTVDFALIYCLFIAFYAAGRLETYQFAFLYLAMLTILSLQLCLTATGRSDEVATTKLGKLTGALQYAYLLFLVALEVIDKSQTIIPSVETFTIATVDTVFFTVLAIAIVANSVECVLVMRNMTCQAASGEQQGD